MGLAKPAWYSLFSRAARLDTTAARNSLSNNVRLVEQNGLRVLLTTYGNPRAALVPLRDLAIIEVLDAHPELKAKVEKLLPK